MSAGFWSRQIRADAFLPMRRNPLLLRLTLRERGKMPLESPVLSMSFSNRAMTKSQADALLV
jgi:hypothetical protein